MNPPQKVHAGRPALRAARALALLFALVAAAAADKVVLKDGRTYEGVVLEETEQSVRIKTSKAVLTIPHDQVASVERSPAGPLQERETRLAALNPSKPADYLATAQWMAGAGREAFDLPTVRRLCTIASKLDRNLAWEAQMLLAKEVETAGMFREAGACLQRAEFAKPGEAETRSRLEAIRKTLTRDARPELELLRKALQFLLDRNYDEALPCLRKARAGAMSERAIEFTGMTMDQLARDIARHVKCRTCDGAGDIVCPDCGGRKESDCAACGGTGTRKNYKGGGLETNLAESACPVCHGLGKILCRTCKAERDVIVYIATAPGNFTVSIVAGLETEGLQKEVDLQKFTHKGVKVTMILANPPKSGGRMTCRDCEGIKFDPAAVPPPTEKLKAWHDEVDGALTGSKPYDPLPPADKAWDPAVIADEFLRYVNGKWTR